MKLNRWNYFKWTTHIFDRFLVLRTQLSWFWIITCVCVNTFNSTSIGSWEIGRRKCELKGGQSFSFFTHFCKFQLLQHKMSKENKIGMKYSIFNLGAFALHKTKSSSFSNGFWRYFSTWKIFYWISKVHANSIANITYFNCSTFNLNGSMTTKIMFANTNLNVFNWIVCYLHWKG